MSAAPVEQLYEDDFYAWTQAQAKELRRFARSRPNLPLDLAHIAEEIADLGTEQRKGCAAGRDGSSSTCSCSSTHPLAIPGGAGVR